MKSSTSSPKTPRYGTQTAPLPAADGVLVSLLASCLIRLEGIAGYLRDHGLLDEDGNPRGVIETEAKLRREAADHAEALGMSPRARAKIGLDLIRAASAADDEAANREARERLDRRLDALDLDAGSAAAEERDHEQRQSGHERDDPRHGVSEDQEDDSRDDQEDSSDPLKTRRRAQGFHGESVPAEPRQIQ